jgi:hypothetical protein
MKDYEATIGAPCWLELWTSVPDEVAKIWAGVG